MKIIADLSELDNVAAQLVQQIGDETIVLLEGEMGAGKTTLIKSIAKQLSVVDQVSSPTFSIVNEYESADKAKIYHFDFYRIESDEEALDIGIDDYFYSGNLCLIEWGQNVANLLPETHVKIQIEINAQERSYTIE